MSLFAAVLVAALLGVSHAATTCFSFTGDLAKDSYKVYLGDLMTITWTTSTSSACSAINSGTDVRLEMWDDDLFSDEKLFNIATIKNTGKFEWNFPYDTTELNNKASGFFEGSPDLYVKIVVTTNTDLSGKSLVFDHDDSNAKLRVIPPTTKAFATGSEIFYQVETFNLPSRQLSTTLHNKDGSVRLGTFTSSSSGTSVHRRVFTPSAGVKTGTYWIVAETSDSKSPYKKYVMPAATHFTITQVENDLKLVAPTASTSLKANTNLEVKWTYTTGFHDTAKVNIELWRDDTFTFDNRIVLKTGIDMSDRSYMLFLPPDLEGSNYYVKLIPQLGSEFTKTSPNFTIQKAARSCKLLAPLRSQVLERGQQVDVKYECTGYATDVKVDVKLAERVRSTTTMTPIVIKEGASTVGTQTVPITLQSNLQQGWQWYVTFKTTADDVSQSSDYFLITDAQEQCGGAAEKRAITAKCAADAGEFLAVTPYEEYELTSIAITSKALAPCLTGYSLIELKQNWKVENKQMTDITVEMKVFDNAAQTEQQLIVGDNVAAFGGTRASFFKFVVKNAKVANNVLTFTAGVKYTSSYSIQWLGQVSVDLAKNPTCEDTTSVLTQAPQTSSQTVSIVTDNVVETASGVSGGSSSSGGNSQPTSGTNGNGNTPATSKTGSGAAVTDNSSSAHIALSSAAALLVALAAF